MHAYVFGVGGMATCRHANDSDDSKSCDYQKSSHRRNAHGKSNMAIANT